MLRFLTGGGRDGPWWPALSGHCYPVPDVYIYYVLDMINIWDLVFIFIHLPWMFPPTDIPFLNNGLDDTEWASFISDLHAKLRIINREVPGFATGSPCGVWDRGWKYHLPHVCWSTFGSFFLKNNSWYVIWCSGEDYAHIFLNLFLVLVCFYITQVLPRIIPHSIFLLWNKFYKLYQVLCPLLYSIDVVSTLSFYII